MADRIDIVETLSRATSRRHVVHLECPSCRRLSRLRIEVTDSGPSSRSLRTITCSRCERVWTVQLEGFRVQRIWQQASPSRFRLLG